MLLLQRVLLGLLHRQELLLLRYLIIISTLSGTCAINATTITPTTTITTTNTPITPTTNITPTTTRIPSTNIPVSNDTATPTISKEIVVTEFRVNAGTETYTEIQGKVTAEETTQIMTTQLATDISGTTQVSSIPVTSVVSTRATLFLPSETQSTQRRSSSYPTPVISHSTDSLITTLAQSSAMTSESANHKATLNSSSSTTTVNQPAALNSGFNNVAATTNSNYSSSTKETTPYSIISTSSEAAATTNSNYSSSTKESTLYSITSTSEATATTSSNYSSSTKKGTLSSIISSEVTTTERSDVGTKNLTTHLNTLSVTTTNSHRKSTEQGLLSSGVGLTSSRNSDNSVGNLVAVITGKSTVNYVPNSRSTTDISNNKTVREHAETFMTNTQVNYAKTNEFLASTAAVVEKNVRLTTFIVEDTHDKDELPFLLVMIASTVGILVILLVLIFVVFVCIARKRQQRRKAKYYDYKKRWVKRAPRPKYEKVKQRYRYDREAAGSGWVFQDGADPSKQITLELRPRSMIQSSPQGTSNNRNSNSCNFNVLSETYPPDVLSSPEVALDLDGSRLMGSGGAQLLSKTQDRADQSSSSEGDSGILALGDDLWSPTKGVPFHFVSDDAIIEL